MSDTQWRADIIDSKKETVRPKEKLRSQSQILIADVFETTLFPRTIFRSYDQVGRSPQGKYVFFL